MADHVSSLFSPRTLRLVCAIAVAASCAACAGIEDQAGYATVTQDKFDFMDCPLIITQRNGLIKRETELDKQVAKTEASPGGAIVSHIAYRSELTSTRAQLRAIDRAVKLKNCQIPK